MYFQQVLRDIHDHMQKFTLFFLYVNIISIAQWLSGANFEILHSSGVLTWRQKLCKPDTTFIKNMCPSFTAKIRRHTVSVIEQLSLGTLLCDAIQYLYEILCGWYTDHRDWSFYVTSTRKHQDRHTVSIRVPVHLGSSRALLYHHSLPYATLSTWLFLMRRGICVDRDIGSLYSVSLESI